MGEPVLDGQVTFKQGTSYWSNRTPHAIMPSYMRGIGRKRWGLKDGEGETSKDFVVPKATGCDLYLDGLSPRQRARYTTQGMMGCADWNDHKVPEKLVYQYVMSVLKMVPDEPVTIEKIVEVQKLVEVPLMLSFEEREVLAFALTRERLLTEEELREAYDYEDALAVVAIGGRIKTIRELYEMLMLPEATGRPTWLLERREPQMELFEEVADAL